MLVATPGRRSPGCASLRLARLPWAFLPDPFGVHTRYTGMARSIHSPVMLLKWRNLADVEKWRCPTKRQANLRLPDRLPLLRLRRIEDRIEHQLSLVGIAEIGLSGDALAEPLDE